MDRLTVLFALKYKNEGLNCALRGLFEAICKTNAGQFNHGDVFIAKKIYFLLIKKKNLDGHSRNELMAVA